MIENTNLIKIKQYEIKFFVDVSKVLDESFELKNDIGDIFQVHEKPKAREILFIDTINKDMYNDGWILRNRKKTDKYELTYKKRYVINNNDISTVLDEIYRDGFKEDTKFNGELEWGYTNKKLSLSLEINEPISEALSINNISIEELQKMFLKNAPVEFRNWKQNTNWGIEQINKSKVYCPIKSKVYKGKWDETEINIEVWSREINDKIDSIVEISFKEKDEDSAISKYSKLKELLYNKELLIMKDFPKTEWALDCCK